ncbi:hypothetical protein BDZ94DRAFT_1261952 [Collybia nuda]|uniref:Uncharacterized protein n=1 Tax=Collybia nuda TaxID=64659 RepID=A0A9P5Y4H6_9AGAR|nr:hypothetical protein BDZ94DRAFT_1261952 [Collybia nuda]
MNGVDTLDRNFAMMDWLKSNSGGSKADFEAHYKTLSPADKEVCASSKLYLTLAEGYR